ncbi:dynamin family protein [Corynebacterium resistens]|uniref:dynamin family protein n=1 Tax=Corynebacterium resistens TaxID=258224 RepID=UPI00235749FC|nr:dynamin family protein [Corynebacterium resistens]
MTNGQVATQRQQAEVLLQFLTEKILDRYDKKNVTLLAWKKFSADDQTRTVVIVGEVSRGKSALANALVGVKNASPVGVNFTTAVSVGLGQSTAENPEWDTELFYSDHSVRISHNELPSYIDGKTQAQKLKEGKDVATRAFVSLPASQMNCLVIDTPGVGGLDPQHAQLAQSSAEQASVLVMVCDASTPITAPEMEFIRTAGRHMDNVLVAVTKIDKHLPRYEQIMQDNERLLQQHLGRKVEVIGVSSLLAVYDDPNLSPADIQKVRQASGIENLRTAIATRFDSAQNLPAINGLRVAIEGLKDLKAELRTKSKATQDAEAALPELNSQLDKLQNLKKEMERWEQYLARDITHARQKALDSLDADLEAIKQKWTNRVNKQGMAVLRKSPQHYTALMEKDFQEAVLKAIGIFSSDLENRIVKPRFESPTTWDEIAEEIAVALGSKKLQTTEVKKKTDGLFDPMMLLMGASGGSIIGAALAGVVSFSGLGVIAGVGWVTFNVGFRAMRSGKQNLLMWIRETTGTTKMFTSRLLEAAIANARPAIVIRYREQLRTSIEETQQQIQTAKNAAAMEQKTREANIARLNKNIEIIEKNITRGEALIEELRTDRGGQSVTPAQPTRVEV